jgi:hypothetical protein
VVTSSRRAFLRFAWLVSIHGMWHRGYKKVSRDNTRASDTYDCPFLSGSLILDTQVDRGPKRPGFVQLRRVQSSSYLF